MEEEILQCFDENKNPTEGRPKSEVKSKPNRYWYGVSSIWVINNQGQMLCSQRALHLIADPGKWQTYFGGHVRQHQTFMETAVKELREEAGINAKPEDLSLIEAIKKPEEKCFAERYAILFNEPTIDLAKTDGETAAVRWMSVEQYWQEQNEHPEMWCCACRPAQYELIRQWLSTKLK